MSAQKVLNVLGLRPVSHLHRPCVCPEVAASFQAATSLRYSLQEPLEFSRNHSRLPSFVQPELRGENVSLSFRTFQSPALLFYVSSSGGEFLALLVSNGEEEEEEEVEEAFRLRPANAGIYDEIMDLLLCSALLRLCLR